MSSLSHHRIVSGTVGRFAPHRWALAVGAIVAAFGQIAFVSDRFPIIRDNRRFMLEAFWYVSESVRLTGALPSWASMGWGVPLAVLSNNYLVLSPWRLIGYACSGLLGISTVEGYRLSLFVGFAGLLVGLYLLFLEIIANKGLSAFLTLLAAFSGLTFGNFHQEQALSTVFWMPFVLCLLLQGARENRPRSMVCAGGLAGAACTAHYPQIPLIFLALVAVAFLATGNWQRLLPSSARTRHYIFAAGLFLFVSSPTWVAVLSYAGDFTSPFRQTQTIALSNYADYVTLNREMKSSAKPEYFHSYLAAPTNPFAYLLDDYPYHIGRLTLFLAVTGIVGGSSIAWALTVIAVGLAFLTLGINSFAVPVLFHIGGSFISMFRQWYHFQSVFNLTLFLLAAVGTRELVFTSRQWSRRRRLVFAIAVCGMAVAFIARSSSTMDAAWIAVGLAALLTLCVAQGRGRLRHLVLAILGLMAVADQWLYVGVTRQGVYQVERLQDKLRDGRPLSDAEEPLDHLYARRGLPPFSLNLLLENKRISALRAAGRPEAAPDAMNTWVLLPTSPGASVLVHDHSIPGDLWIEVSTPGPAQLVFMNAFDRGWRVEINGRAGEVRPVLEAFVGIALDPGSSRIHLHHSDPWWTLAVGVHFVALMGIGMAALSGIPPARGKTGRD
jgi:hypothetical protein